MKKILNRVMAAAIAVPMVLTQGVVMNISAEDTGAKALTLDAFTAIPADQTESTWNTNMLTVVASMEGTEKEIAKEDFLELIPQTNSYGVLLKEILTEASNPVLTVNGGVITISGSADLSNYAEAKIYSKVREALAEEGYTDEVQMDTFNKTVEYAVTVDANVLLDGKTVDVNVELTCDGTDIKTGTADYFKGLAAELAASVAAQVGTVSADVAEAMDVELISKLETAEKWYNKANTLERTGSYATADEMMAAIANFVNSRTDVYDFPATVDEAVARHGNGFNKAVELINGITVTSGYILDVTAEDVANVAKVGSNFEVSASAGEYVVSFQIPDAEAAEVEAYVNANSTDGTVYDNSYKIVEASVTTTGVAFFNVTRVIVTKAVEDTTTTTTTTDTTSDTTTTTTTSDSTTSSDTTTTTTDTGSDTTTTTTETTTTSGSDTTTTTTDTGSDTTTTTTTTTTEIPEEFVLESVEVEAGKGYYFSHDENAFDLTSLVNSLTLVGTLDGEAYTIDIAADDFAAYLTPAYATPAEYFNAEEGTAYIASELALTFTAPETMTVSETADLTVSGPTVYIGVKGDADLNGKVEIADATLVLAYYANNAAQLDSSLNEDAELEVLAYFLADIDTVSTAGADSDAGKLEIADATKILTYYASAAAELDPDWDAIIGG